MSKRVVVLNVSGNVGKTTVSAQLLYPRLVDTEGKAPILVEVETYNKSAAGLPGITAVAKTGSQYRDVYEMAYEDINLIVDVGASNIVPFFQQLSNFEGSAHIFDLFVIPTTAGAKEMADTLKTIQLLRSYGVENDRLKVILNRVEADVVGEFRLLYDASSLATYAFTFDPALTIFETELFKELGELGETVTSLLEDKTDYHSLIRTASDPQEKKRYIRRDMARRMAASVNRNLDAVFQELGLSEPVPSQKHPAKDSKKQVNA